MQNCRCNGRNGRSTLYGELLVTDHAIELSCRRDSLMERHSRSTLTGYLDIWLLSAALAAGLLTGVNCLHANESSNVESDSEDNHSCQSGSSKCCKKGECHGVCLDPGHPTKPKHKRPGDIDEGDCPSIRYRMDDCLRSGDPECVYKWAKPSITNKYSAWYVGGGSWFKGRGRTAEEGTWGLDYDGAFGHARTWLNYTCGKRQGGEGAYETDHVPLKKKF